MALVKSAGATTIKSVFITSRSAGSGGAVYTVPAGKVFKGYIIVENVASSQLAIYINGTQITTALGNTAGTGQTWAPFILSPGTSLTNSSTDYFILTGELFDGS